MKMRLASGFFSAIALCIALSVPAQAVILWDNGPLVNVPGGGSGGADLSRLNANENTLGYGHQTTANNRVADDFRVPAGQSWQVDSIQFFAYQTGATAASLTGLNAAIGSSAGDSSVGNFVGGAGAFNVPTIYRASSTATTDTSRRIQTITVPVNAQLASGDYWVTWSAAGSLTSGPWAPPVSYANADNGPNPVGDAPNAMQSVSGGAFAAVADGLSLTPDELPFIINGSIVPEPVCGALMLALCSFAALRRR